MEKEKELYKKIEEVLLEQWPQDGAGKGGAIHIGAFRNYLKEKGVDIEALTK